MVLHRCVFVDLFVHKTFAVSAGPDLILLRQVSFLLDSKASGCFGDVLFDLSDEKCSGNPKKWTKE